MTDVLDLLERGRLFRASGDPSTAARYLTEAAAAEPTSRSVLLELALAHYGSAALRPAEQVLRRLVELDPSDGYARLVLGRTLTRQSRHDEALPELRMAAVLSGGADVAAEVARCELRLATSAVGNGM